MDRHVYIVTNSGRIADVFRKVKAGLELPEGCAVDCVLVSGDDRWDTSWEERLSDAGSVIAKWMGGRVLSFWSECTRFLEERHIPYALIPNQEDKMKPPFLMDESIAAAVRTYLFYSGEENFKNLILYMAASLCGADVSFQPPRELVWSGIYHPRMKNRCMTDLSAYRKAFCRDGRPVVGVLFYRDEWLWGDLAYKDALIAEIERQGMNPVCVFANGRPDPALGMPSMKDVFQRYFMDGNKPFADVVLNTMKFSLTAGGLLTTKDLSRMGIPIFEAYTLMTEYDDWKASEEGMNPMAVSISVSLPELDGAIHGVPVASRHIRDDGSVVYAPIQDRIQRMVRRAGKWAVLRRKNNKEKKIAVIFHNYPAKNSNIGSASGLDSIESAIRLLRRMKDDGYDVDHVPASREELLKELTSHATNDRAFLTDEQAAEAQRLSKADYLRFWKTLSPETQKEMTEKWGPAPGSYLLGDDGALLLPGYFDGSIFLTVQPSRGGAGEDAEAVYHNLHEPPTHQYLAFYDWLQNVWHADAVIHMGTHGTQEWLPGKGVALDKDSYGDITIGDMPNLYPYFMTIAGEGMQAKRRGSAVLVGYLPAPVEESGVYDQYAELEKLLDEYAKAAKNSPGALQSIEKMILAKVKKADLDGDLPYKKGAPFAPYAEQIHTYLESLEESTVHTGLHIFGKAPEGKELAGYIREILRIKHGDVPALCDFFAGRRGFSADRLRKTPGAVDDASGRTYGELLKEARQEGKAFVDCLVEGGFTAEAEKKAISLYEGSLEWRSEAEKLAHFIAVEVYPRLAETTEEEDHLLDGLSGRYIEPGPSGSPAAGGIQILPSGRNFYGADPRSLPSPAAWEMGKKLGDALIERFIREEGRYPENIGLVLWSGPNMRTSGQDVAEILYLMGIQPQWQPGTFHVGGLSVMALSQLKRPRLDVTCRISGLFRDTLPAVIDLIDKAVLLAASQKESGEDNFLRKHVEEDSAALRKEGETADDAWRAAAYRIFGNARGAYGAGVSNILESKQWKDEKDLAKVFIRWGGHAYGGGKKGLFRPELFTKRLASMDMTVKNDDTHEMNLLSSDDYNAFHGGMIAAVKSLSGKVPRSYEGDSANGDHPVMRTVEEEMKRVFRTEAMNPKYIEGMKKYGYKGASDMANLLAHSFAWDATSSVMDDWMYDSYARKYALDPDMQQWMKKANPWAQQRIAETLLEASQRGLWKASPEMEEKLRRLYLSVEGELEEDDDNDE